MPRLPTEAGETIRTVTRDPGLDAMAAILQELRLIRHMLSIRMGRVGKEAGNRK